MLKWQNERGREKAAALEVTMSQVSSELPTVHEALDKLGVMAGTVLNRAQSILITIQGDRSNPQDASKVPTPVSIEDKFSSLYSILYDADATLNIVQNRLGNC